MADLPWVTCYRQTLRAENKSENTQKSYASGLRALVETTLPDEDVLDEAGYDTMSVETLAERMEPLNGRLDRFVEIHLWNGNQLGVASIQSADPDTHLAASV